MKKNWPVIILISIAIALCFQNYTPGTFLSGWDTLHPEFNFGLNIKREIFGVFRTYQGLGAVAAHSDMADLPRIILLYFLSPFIPMSFLRYSYIFLTLILGPIGMYYFLKRVVFSKTPNDSTIPSFLGALFYLLNLGTMQQFIVPFEMFTTQYASLPWLFLFATEYLNTKTYQKKTLILFAITTLLSTPMAYAATLWYVYFIAFILYVGSLSLLLSLRGAKRRSQVPYGTWRSNLIPLEIATPVCGLVRNDRKGETTTFQTSFSLAKKASILILLTLLINSFWILPNIYFVFNHASEVIQANINKLFSPQAFLYNKEFGNIADISMLKSFLFDWNVYAGNNQFSQLLSPWIQHLKEPFVELLAYLFALLAFVGIIYSILKGNKILIALLPLLFLCLLFLFNDNSPSSYLYTFLADRIPIFKEAFRFPQDKVFGIFIFVFAVYFAIGQSLITNVYKRIKTAQVVIFVALILYFMLPAFKGHFISPYMRIKIPEVYFKMFKWFDKEPQDGRIANLPIHSLWGWEYHDWNGVPMDIGTSSPASEADRRGQDKNPSFQGAGFIWFGIKQPVLARDFDRWSPYNEQYYREMSYAIYSENPAALKQVIEKYNIKYILIDKSIIAPQDNPKVLLHQETQTLLDKQEYIEKVKEFGNNLIVYRVDSSVILSASEGSHGILPLRQAQGQNDKTVSTISYPFRNLIDNQNKILPNILKLTQEGIVIRLPKDNITLPSLLDTQESLPSDLVVEKNQNQLTVTLYPRLPTLDTKDRPTPITIKAPIPESENIILSINKKDNFMLNPTPNTPLSLGTIFLKTKEDSTITLYPSTPNEKITPDLSTIRHSLEPCGDIREQNTSFGIEKIQNNAFYLFGKNTHLCMTIPLSEVILKDLKTSEALLNVTFNYKSNLPLKFCLAKLINGACQNYSDNRLNQYFGLQEQDIQDLGLKFQLDTTNSNNVEKAFYSNLILSLTNPFFIETLPNDALKKSLQNLSQNSLFVSTLILPYSSNRQLSADITKLPRTTGHCPNHPIFNPPLIKKEILENKEERFIRYESIDGLSCDHFSYQNISQNEAYLIAITSRNIKGLPSTLCITNAVSRHCDIYTTLSSHKDFNTDIFLLPPQIKDENGFDINLGNLGIKKSPSINDLKSIEIIPIPYKWLTHIKTLSADPKQNPSSVLVLPQSFEKGWKAYKIELRTKNSELRILLESFFPFFFGEELKEHVLVNGWGNGWILDSSKFKVQSSKFVVVFLPQYLEYLGFFLLLGSVVWLMKKS